MTEQEEQHILLDFAETELAVTHLAKKYKRDFYTIKRLLLTVFSEQELKERERRIKSKQKLLNNPMRGKCGLLHHNAKERTICSSGYIEVFAPDWYTGNTDGNKVYEHIVVYCSNNNLTELPPGHVIHHIDLSKDNNTPNNLCMMSIGCHVQFHRALNKGATTIHEWSSFQEEYEARRVYCS